MQNKQCSVFVTKTEELVQTLIKNYFFSCKFNIDMALDSPLSK